jgi:hypothetical protein
MYVRPHSLVDLSNGGNGSALGGRFQTFSATGISSAGLVFQARLRGPHAGNPAGAAKSALDSRMSVCGIESPSGSGRQQTSAALREPN